MKKLFYVAAVALVAALASCGNAEKAAEETTTEEPTAEATEVVNEEVTETVDSLPVDSANAVAEDAEKAE